MTEQHLDLLRQMALMAETSDQDVGLSSNVLIALLDKIGVLQDEVAAQHANAKSWERRARELESLCSDRL